MIAARIRSAGTLLLGLVIWPFLLPLGVKRLYRIARRLVRKLVKPVALWINACRYQESEHEVSRLEAARQDATRLMERERKRQVQLRQQRAWIAGW